MRSWEPCELRVAVTALYTSFIRVAISILLFTMARASIPLGSALPERHWSVFYSVPLLAVLGNVDISPYCSQRSPRVDRAIEFPTLIYFAWRPKPS